jgi:hypothetical protein
MPPGTPGACRVCRRPAAEQQQAAEGERVGIEDPGQAGRGEVQAAGDARQGDVHHRQVEDDHELGAEHDGEGHAARSLRPESLAGPRIMVCGIDDVDMKAFLGTMTSSGGWLGWPRTACATMMNRR